MAPKEGKWTDRDHNLISSVGGQDTSACKILGHSLHAFSGKCPETSPDGRTDRRTDGQTSSTGLVWWCPCVVISGHCAVRSFLCGDWTNYVVNISSPQKNGEFICNLWCDLWALCREMSFVWWLDKLCGEYQFTAEKWDNLSVICATISTIDFICLQYSCLYLFCKS